MQTQEIQICNAGMYQHPIDGLQINFIVYLDNKSVLCGVVNSETSSVTLTANRFMVEEDKEETIKHVFNSFGRLTLSEAVADFIYCNEIVLPYSYSKREPIYVDDLVVVYEGIPNNIITCAGEVITSQFIFEPINLVRGLQ